MGDITNDMVWKSAIENYFEEFMQFFAPDISQDIDFSKEYINLDKELAKIAPRSKQKHRRCDELLKVTMKNGEEEYVLIHIEVQGYEDKEFAKRMYQYMYRIYDKYNKKIYPLAIYTHDVESNQPDRYEEKFYGMELTYKFPAYKTIEQNERKLEEDLNPFATVILAALYATQTKTDEEQRFKFKQKLSKMLLKKGWARRRIIELFYYIDNIMTLNDEDKNKKIITEFENEINEEDIEMKFTFDETNYAQVLRRKALEEGKAEGKAAGRAAGRAEGRAEGVYMVAANLLKKGISIDIIAETTSLPKEKIVELGKIKA